MLKKIFFTLAVFTLITSQTFANDSHNATTKTEVESKAHKEEVKHEHHKGEHKLETNLDHNKHSGHGEKPVESEADSNAAAH